jgi:signal transduction histidine kinase
MKLRVVLFLLSLLSVTWIHAQIQELDSLLEKKKYTTFNDRLEKVNLDPNQYAYYQGKSHLQKREIGDAIEVLRSVDTTQMSDVYKAWYYYVLGDSYRYRNKEEKGFEFKLKAQELFKQTGNKVMSNQINYDLHYTLSAQEFLDYDGESYLKIFLENAKKMKVSKQLLAAHLTLSISNLLDGDKERGWFHIKEATRYSKLIGTPEAFYKVHNYKVVFFQNTGEYEEARKHSDSLLYYAKLSGSPDRMDTALKNSAEVYRLQSDDAQAVEELLKAEKLTIHENVYNRKKHLYKYLALNSKSLGRTDLSFKYLEEMIKYSDSIHIDKQNATLIELETTELSKKNMLLEEEKLRNNLYLYLSLAGLIVLLTTSIAIISHYRKQKLIAIKEKEVEAINARHEEKEKQRRRFAGKLHDDIGSVLVAIGNCLESLGIVKEHYLKEEELLVTKARTLLDKAYQKMRNIAHIEYAASKTSYWLDAIKDFASTVTEFNQLSIEINTFGLEDFVDVALEKDLRRIVIELITNILKHAKATEVSIEIVKRNSLLNIVIEDNGVGFDTAQLETTQGIGLNSIHQKIQQLKGEFKVDSQENRGTTIIIEIPV